MTQVARMASLALLLLLAGCISATKPMFPVDRGVQVLGDGGRYATYERTSDGKFKKDETITVRPRDKTHYDFINAEGKVTPIAFFPMPGGLYLGQAEVKSKTETSYGFLIIRIKGSDVLIHAPQCANQDKAKLTALGVTLRGKYECVIDGVADPAALFAALDIGPVVSMMVRE
jgi:hypothetical protein